MKNKIFSLLTVLLVVVNLTLSVGAAGSGSIKVNVQYNDKLINDGKLNAVLVGYADQTNQYKTVFTQESVNNIDSWSTVNKMSAFYTDNKSKYDFFKKTADIKDGKAIFSDLETGLYLIFQDTASTGYYPLSTFLVSVPYWDGTKYQYDVDATVKTALGEMEPTPTETTGSDSTPDKLPQTGQLTWPIPVMAAAGMALFAFGWWLCFGSRRGNR